MEQYCIYLRKSRSDQEAEARGEQETLSRHESILTDLATKRGYIVTAVYREVVSGETIASRPQMQRLLKEVEQGLWDGVLVMEVERLARGDTIDQGIVARSFQFSDTKIITPQKIYNPNNEFDEEYFEFGLFMSRREYKTIRRRLIAGRLSSAREGKFCGNKPPYGYRRIKLPKEKGYTLEPTTECEIVNAIFSWYVKEHISMNAIAQLLTDRQIPSPGGLSWTASSISAILSNPVYAGYISYGRRQVMKVLSDGQVIKTRPRNNKALLYEGRHPPLVDRELYAAAQALRKKRTASTASGKRKPQNPLAGLIFCSLCGRPMVRRPYPDKEAVLICTTPGCPTVSSCLSQVEICLVKALSKVLLSYSFIPSTEHGTDTEASLKKYYQKELTSLCTQRSRLYDLLEQGIYSPEEFQNRLQLLKKRMETCTAALKEEAPVPLPPTELSYDTQRALPLLSYYSSLDVPTKNMVLKLLLKKVIYEKSVRCSYGCGEQVLFSLDLYPRISD